MRYNPPFRRRQEAHRRICMSLVTKVVSQIEPETRKEGAKIRSRGDVTIHEHQANRIEASVFAGQTHGVILKRQKDEILYSCDCPDYEESLDPCKHVWATIIEADALGYLAGWERGSSIELLPAEEYGEETDFDEDEDIDGLAMNSARLLASRAIKPNAKANINGGWKHSFQFL